VVAAQPRNLIVFVADGLRAGSVDPTDAPTMSALRAAGVSFADSHAVFPTFTTPNAATIATGHYPGDTGDFSNSLYIGYRSFNAGNFGQRTASSTPFLEDDRVLGDLDDHYGGNYLGAATLLSIARMYGYSTAAIGKLGPAAIQDVSQLEPQPGVGAGGSYGFTTPQTVIIDDDTGTTAGVPLAPEVALDLLTAGLPLSAPPRIQPAGNDRVAGTRNPNSGQQVYFVEAATRVVLPLFISRGRPFVLVYWSRDPDGTQHNEGDSLNRLVPGINGRTSHEAIRNADDNLRQLLEFIDADPQLAATTDVFVTSDHGFATISKHDIDAQHHGSASPAAQEHYTDVPGGFLPPGFLAIDLAAGLHQPLYDPDTILKDSHGNPIYRRIGRDAHPRFDAFIGGSGRPQAQPDADVIIAANGGSDLIYLPHGDAALARRVAQLLAGFDYIGGIFAAQTYGPLPGTLPLSTLDLSGDTKLPTPAIVVAFKTFDLNARETGLSDPLLNAVQVSDTTGQQGQGDHGGLGRDNTFNFMAAAGPDFRRRYRDGAPASNADITPTLLRVLGLPWPSDQGLTGRALTEALRAGGAPPAAERCVALSAPSADGRRTILWYQRAAGRLYVDESQFRVARPGERDGCQPEGRDRGR
jgi:arylsulfatase A-like enzyme